MAQAATASAAGNLYVTGYSDGSDGRLDFATIGYSGSSLPLWTNRYSGLGHHDDYANAVAVGSNGNVYVSGGSFTDRGYADYATVAYSGVGVPLWTNRYSGDAALNNSAYCVATDSKGNVFVAGWSDGAGTGRDHATVAYSSAGVGLWTNRYDGVANGNDYTDHSFCMAVGPDGAVYVTGSSDGVGSGLDYATIKYVPAPDIRFTMTRPLVDGTYQLRINAPTNVAFRLEASSDLANWLALTNFPALGASLIQYKDKTAASFPRRFYRTAWSP